jgi:hypothetical protein
MSYIYKQTEFGQHSVFTVGTYQSGEWIPESDHGNTIAASKRVHYLNGGTDERLVAELEATKSEAASWLHENEQLKSERDSLKIAIESNLKEIAELTSKIKSAYADGYNKAIQG